MADVIAPGKTVQFTIKKTPTRSADQKTIRRLMRMQPSVQKGLEQLAKKRRDEDNRSTIRAGKQWIIRVTTTKLTHPVQGEQFTLRLAPNIIPDIKSVEKYLDASPA